MITDGPKIIFPSSFELEKSMMLVEATAPCGCESAGECVAERQNSQEPASSGMSYLAGSATEDVQLKELPKYQK